MEKKHKKEELKEKAGVGRRTESETSQKLTQRLYASYSESQILIPNEVTLNLLI